MDVRFYGTWHGRKLYRVIREGRDIFTGTRGECNRFIRLHLEKCEKETRDLSRRRRRRPFEKRYRISVRSVNAFVA